MQTTRRDFDSLIRDIRKTKLEFNDKKIEGWGHYDNDDHGWIPLERPHFEPETDSRTGLCTGPALIGRGFRGWLAVHPVYIHPSSAVAGAWISTAPRVGEWKDRPRELEPIWKKYNPGLTLQKVNSFLCKDLRMIFRSRCIYSASFSQKFEFCVAAVAASSGTPRRDPAPAARHLLLSSCREMRAFPGASHSSRLRHSAVSSRSYLSWWKCR